MNESRIKKLEQRVAKIELESHDYPAFKIFRQSYPGEPTPDDFGPDFDGQLLIIVKRYGEVTL